MVMARNDRCSHCGGVLGDAVWGSTAGGIYCSGRCADASLDQLLVLGAKGKAMTAQPAPELEK